jgi:hypothetical protein
MSLLGPKSVISRFVNAEKGVESHVGVALTKIAFLRARRSLSECLRNDLQKSQVFVQTGQHRRDRATTILF